MQSLLHGPGVISIPASTFCLLCREACRYAPSCKPRSKHSSAAAVIAMIIVRPLWRGTIDAHRRCFPCSSSSLLFIIDAAPRRERKVNITVLRTTRTICVGSCLQKESVRLF